MTCYPNASGEQVAFRLSFTVIPRNPWDAYFHFRKRMNRWADDQIRGDDTVHQKLKRVDRYWYSKLQKPGARDESRFLFDIDDISEHELRRLHATLEAQTAVVVCEETPNGYHIVTAPFNHTALETDVEYELKTDGLLFLEYLSSHDDTTSARE